MHADLYLNRLHDAARYMKSSAYNEVWFQSLILILSAAIAIYTLRATSKSERRRATVDIVRDQQTDTALIAARVLVRGLNEKPGGIPVAQLLLGSDDSAEVQAIFTVLNSYEFLATGMKNRAFDRKTYKSMYHNNVVRDWAMLQPFVLGYREKYAVQQAGVKGMRAKTLFQDFEKLATKWQKRPLWTRKVAVGSQAAAMPGVLAALQAGAAGGVNAAAPKAKVGSEVVATTQEGDGTTNPPPEGSAQG